jgi:hypothetical protein
MQTTLTFDKPLTPERNKNGGQANLDENRAHFSAQALKVLSHLLNGEWVDGLTMFEMYRIHDVRARIFSIKQHIELQEEKIPNAKGAKRWRISPGKLSHYKKLYL